MPRRLGETFALAEQRRNTIARVIYISGAGVAWAIAFLTILPIVGVNIGPLIATAGIGGIAIGFGAQRLVRDILNGAFILIEDQYSIGDVVAIAGQTGVVHDISLRRTVLRTVDGVMHHVPHGEITTVTNYGEGVTPIKLIVPLTRDADLDAAMDALDRVGRELVEDPECAPFVLGRPWLDRVDQRDDMVALEVMVEAARPGRQRITAELRRRLRAALTEAAVTVSGPIGSPDGSSPAGAAPWPAERS